MARNRIIIISDFKNLIKFDTFIIGASKGVIKDGTQYT
jgi:hypothetical protein